jgi:hypothetical protein
VRWCSEAAMVLPRLEAVGRNGGVRAIDGAEEEEELDGEWKRRLE